MKKEEVKKYKLFGGKNLLKCSNCTCGNETCNDSKYFCSNCGVWRIVLALVLLVSMYKVGFIVGAEMTNAGYTDDISSMPNYVMYKRNHTAVGTFTKGKDLDNNGCKISEAAIWSKAEARCVKLYDEAIVLVSVNGDASHSSYVMLSDDKNKLELFYSGSKEGVIVSKKSDSWVSDDGKYSVSKSTNGKFVLSVSGRVLQSQM